MRSKCIMWVSCTAFALGASLVPAEETVSTFTYQGQLKDGGAPVNGSVDLRFRLHHTESGNSTVGSENFYCDMEVTNGLFTVELDFGSGSFDGSERWLSVGVRNPSNGGSCSGFGYIILEPRQKITSAPQAGYSSVAPWSGLEGIPAGFADGVDDSGTLTVPFVANHTGSDTNTITVNQHGLGGAGAFTNDNPDNYWEALFAASNSYGTTLRTINSGTGKAAEFQVLNADSSAPARFNAVDRRTSSVATRTATVSGSSGASRATFSSMAS